MLRRNKKLYIYWNLLNSRKIVNSLINNLYNDLSTFKNWNIVVWICVAEWPLCKFFKHFLFLILLFIQKVKSILIIVIYNCFDKYFCTHAYVFNSTIRISVTKNGSQHSWLKNLASFEIERQNFEINKLKQFYNMCNVHAKMVKKMKKHIKP